MSNFMTITQPHRQQMNRVYLSQVEQLKCNFCTQWFSVPSEFASLQKYSLNACQKCLQNFKYRLVDPTSFQIYDVVLIKTGIQLTNKQYQLTQRFETYMKIHKEAHGLSEESFHKLRDEDMRNSDLKAEVNMYTQPIKERVSETCRKFLDGLIKNWNQILAEIQKGSNKFDEYKENIVKCLADRYYNFTKDPQNLLSNSRIEQGTHLLRQISQDVKKLTAQKMLAKIKQFINQFFGMSLADQNSSPIENKENKTPNEKRNLRNIRQKLMRNSRREDNQLKANCSNIKSNVKSSKKDSGKSSKKLIPRLELPVLKKQSSQKSLTTKTSRAYRIEIEPEPQKQKPLYVMDTYRDNISKLLHQQNELQTYMPVKPQKNDDVLDRTYGQKCLVQYLVQLKMKTSINDNICQLINQNLSKGNLLCYLKSLQWRNSISLIRLVKVRMHDAEFDYFLNWLRDKPMVQILVITNNFLTELSVEAVHAFCSRHRDMGLRQIYMGNNYIKPSRARRAIQGLRGLGIQVYI